MNITHQVAYNSMHLDLHLPHCYLDGIRHALKCLGISLGVAGGDLGRDAACHALLIKGQAVGDDVHVVAHGRLLSQRLHQSVWNVEGLYSNLPNVKL